MKITIVNQGMGDCLLGTYHQSITAPIPQKHSVIDFDDKKYRVVTCEYTVQKGPQSTLHYDEVTLFVNNL
ncbi:hypothetical protein VPHD518_0043 [Vibrio phage D518]